MPTTVTAKGLGQEELAKTIVPLLGEDVLVLRFLKTDWIDGLAPFIAWRCHKLMALVLDAEGMPETQATVLLQGLRHLRSLTMVCPDDPIVLSESFQAQMGKMHHLEHLRLPRIEMPRVASTRLLSKSLRTLTIDRCDMSALKLLLAHTPHLEKIRAAFDEIQHCPAWDSSRDFTGHVIQPLTTIRNLTEASFEIQRSMTFNPVILDRFAENCSLIEVFELKLQDKTYPDLLPRYGANLNKFARRWPMLDTFRMDVPGTDRFQSLRVFADNCPNLRFLCVNAIVDPCEGRVMPFQLPELETLECEILEGGSRSRTNSCIEFMFVEIAPKTRILAH